MALTTSDWQGWENTQELSKSQNPSRPARSCVWPLIASNLQGQKVKVDLSTTEWPFLLNGTIQYLLQGSKRPSILAYNQRPALQQRLLRNVQESNHTAAMLQQWECTANLQGGSF